MESFTNIIGDSSVMLITVELSLSVKSDVVGAIVRGFNIANDVVVNDVVSYNIIGVCVDDEKSVKGFIVSTDVLAVVVVYWCCLFF